MLDDEKNKLIKLTICILNCRSIGVLCFFKSEPSNLNRTLRFIGFNSFQYILKFRDDQNVRNNYQINNHTQNVPN